MLTVETVIRGIEQSDCKKTQRQMSEIFVVPVLLAAALCWRFAQTTTITNMTYHYVPGGSAKPCSVSEIHSGAHVCLVVNYF